MPILASLPKLGYLSGGGESYLFHPDEDAL
jgi:hypothetical protein